MESNSWVTRQPGKSIWVLWGILTNAAQLPVWIVYFVPPSLRQHPGWTYKQALLVRIVRAVLQSMAAIQVKTPMSLQPGSEGDRFVTGIRPGKTEKYVGVVAQDSEISPGTISGTWYPNLPVTVSEIGDVVLHLHGGAYVIGDGRTRETGFYVKTVLENTSATHVFCPQYRLASNLGGRFPAALQDAVTAVLYLTGTLHIPASKIVLTGDSAGAHLCLSLLRYIADNPDIKIPNFCSAWLWSPWIDPQVYLQDGGFYKYPNTPTDFLNERLGVWGTRAMAPSKASGMTLTHPNICFLGTAFATPTPLFFSVGECEVLYHDGVKAFEEFRAVSGNKIELQVELKAVHDIVTIGPLVGFEKEAVLAVARAGDFLQRTR